MKRISLIVLTLLFSVMLLSCKKNITEETFKISFVTGFDDLAVESQTVNKNDKVKEPATLEKVGYEFVGWFLDGEKFSFSTKIQKDIVLYANWNELTVVTVKYDYDYENIIKTEDVGVGDVLNEPTIPEREGYQFVGWYLNHEKFNFSESIYTPITLKALWRGIYEQPDEGEIKVFFENYDIDKALINVYQSFDISGDKVIKNSDGTYTLSAGVYCYALRNKDERYYVEYDKVLLITEEKIMYAKENNTVLFVDAYEGLRVNTGSEKYDPITLLNDEITDEFGLRGTGNLTSYNSIDKYQTPALVRMSKGKTHQYTTIYEIGTFLQELKVGNYAYNKYMHIYEVGFSEKYQFPIYGVLFTTANVSGLGFEEALQVASSDAMKNQKARIMHMANIHGSEQAPSEGELAIIYQLAKGTYNDGITSQMDSMEELFDSATFLIIPRLNVDGSHDVTRYQQIRQIDPNRDKLLIQTPENAAMANVYYHFMADLVIDGHELVGDTSLRENGFQRSDVQLGTKTFNVIGEELAMYHNSQLLPYTFQALAQEGFIAFPYNSATGVTNGSNYHALTGALNILVEVRGTAIGLDYYQRRVHSYVTAVKAITDKVIMDAREFVFDLNLSDKNFRLNETVDAYFDLSTSGSVLEMVERRRQQLIDGNLTINLETTRSGLTGYGDTLDIDGVGTNGRFYYDGTISTVSNIRTLNYHDTVASSRKLPNGYFIDAKAFYNSSGIGVNNTTLKEIFDRHQIEYYYVKDINKITVNQIKVTEFDTYPRKLAATSAAKTDVKIVADTTEVALETSFTEGAYFIPVNQLRGLLVGFLLEQDIIDTNLGDDGVLGTNNRNVYHSSLYGAGYLNVDFNNNLPIYRFYGDVTNFVENKVDLVIKNNNNYIQVSEPFISAYNKPFDLTNLYFKVAQNNGDIDYIKVTNEMIDTYDNQVYGLQIMRFSDNNNPNISATAYVRVVETLQEKGNVIFVREDGNDQNNGLSDINAVRTLIRAYELLLEYDSSGGGTIVVSGVVNHSEIYDVLPHHEGLVTITSVYRDGDKVIDYRESGALFKLYRNMLLNGPTIFDNINLKNGSVEFSRHFVAQGNTLEMGQGVETIDANGFYPSITGGKYDGLFVGNAKLIIRNGTWRNLIGANYRGVTVGNVDITIYGGTFTNMFYGGVYQADSSDEDLPQGFVNGNILLTINGGDFKVGVYGGSNYGDVYGDIKVIVNGGTFSGTVNADSNRGITTGKKELIYN